MKNNREQRRSKVKLIQGLPYDPGTRVPRADDKTVNITPQKEGHKKAGQELRHKKIHLD